MFGNVFTIALFNLISSVHFRCCNCNRFSQFPTASNRPELISMGVTSGVYTNVKVARKVVRKLTVSQDRFKLQENNGNINEQFSSRICAYLAIESMILADAKFTLMIRHFSDSGTRPWTPEEFVFSLIRLAWILTDSPDGQFNPSGEEVRECIELWSNRKTNCSGVRLEFNTNEANILFQKD
jgi:hypothetical protein